MSLQQTSDTSKPNVLRVTDAAGGTALCQSCLDSEWTRVGLLFPEGLRGPRGLLKPLEDLLLEEELLEEELLEKLWPALGWL